MTMFRRGLKNSVKNELMRDERFIENLKTLIEVTINLNNKLYERIIEKRYSKQCFGRKNYQIEHQRRNVMLTATFLQRVNRRNRVYQLECLKGFLKTVLRNVKNR